LQQEIYMKNRN